MNLAERAKQIAMEAHEGQKYYTKDGRKPYFLHPAAVAALMVTDEEVMVAYLHDVIEDTDTDPGMLRGIFPGPVVDAVLLLTRIPPYDDYEAYIRRVMLAEGEVGRLARKVKRADLKVNLRGVEVLRTHRRKELHDRYVKALEVLDA